MTKFVVNSARKSKIKRPSEQPLSLSREQVASAFGATLIGETQDKDSAIWTLSYIGQQLAGRLRSTGGRPALEGAGPKRKIPVDDHDWQRIKEISSVYKKVAPSQIASILLHSALEKITEDELEKAIKTRKTVSS